MPLIQEKQRHFRISGSPSWARTSDKRINSPLLYQLSYRGTASIGAHIKRFGLRGQPPDMKG